MTGKDIVAEASKYIGNNGSKFWKDAGIPVGSHWCSAFVWDIFRMAGAPKLFCDGKPIVYVPTAYKWLKAYCKKVSLAGAKAGDIVIFSWKGKGYGSETGTRDHIGIVRKAGNSNIVYTIEGNTGSSVPTQTLVMRRDRPAKYIHSIFRPNYEKFYTIIFKSNNGKKETIKKKVKVGQKITLPKNQFERAGFKFVGWSIGKSKYVNMKRFQLGKVDLKNKASVKNLAKADGTITLYACWKGCGPEAAALWARKIAADNSFMYGEDNHKDWHNGRDRAHQVGCYYCGTTVKGPKKAKKGSKWEKTYCCNSFVFAALAHGANLFKKCKSGSTSADYWCKLKVKGKPLYKKIGRNIAYSSLKPGDILIKEGKHVKMFTRKEAGKFYETHAAGEGWTKKSIRTQRVEGRIGKEYVALRYIGPKN